MRTVKHVLFSNILKSGQWHFHQDNTLVHYSILVTDFLTKIASSSASLSSRPFSLWFWLFPRLRDCRYERIEEMKEPVTKVIETLTKEDFHGAYQKLFERYNKCIAAGEDYFEGD